MEVPAFGDAKEEANYWRQRAAEFEQGLLDARDELEEFQTSSRELELELETQLEHLEKRNRELMAHAEKVTNERDNYKERVESGQTYWNTQISQLQDQLGSLKSEKEKMRVYIREIEQVNDDLERAKRAALASLEDFEARLNQSIERNAILETELDEKEELRVMVQRLREETRDLHQELAVKRRQPSLGNPMNGVSSDVGLSHHPTKLTTDSTAQTDTSPTSSSMELLTPSLRLASLNLVNDALQKIAQLEFKLSTIYRSYGGQLPSPNGVLPASAALLSAATPSFLDQSSYLNRSVLSDRSGNHETALRVGD